jgi:hypothetical protein
MILRSGDDGNGKVYLAALVLGATVTRSMISRSGDDGNGEVYLAALVLGVTIGILMISGSGDDGTSESYLAALVGEPQGDSDLRCAHLGSESINSMCQRHVLRVIPSSRSVINVTHLKQEYFLRAGLQHCQ